MWHAALRDLVWRRRRYSISAVGAALVFAVSLAVTGISDSFPAELDRTFDILGARSFIVPEGVSGPLTGSQPFDPAALPQSVDPMAFFVQTANPANPLMVALVGLAPGRGEPDVSSGHQLDGPDQALVDAASPFETGSTVEVADHRFEVVGRVDDMTLNAGMPVVLIPLASFQSTLFKGLPLVTSGIVHDQGARAAAGFREVSREAAREDALRILRGATSTIDLLKILLWVVAALIVGSVMYLSAVERTRDFAVFKAIGAATAPMAGGVMLQAAVLALSAALLGEVFAFLLAPTFPVHVQLSPTALIAVPVVALLVGLLSAVFALRRAVSVEPALAFGGAT